MTVTALREISYESDLPGQHFSLIVSTDALRYIKNLMIIVHNADNYSVKAYVGFNDDRRMHWLEEIFYSLEDVNTIVLALLDAHVKKNPYCEDEIEDIKEELNSFDFETNRAMSIMFPEY